MRLNLSFVIAAASALGCGLAFAGGNIERVAQKQQLNTTIHHDSTRTIAQSGAMSLCGNANGATVSAMPTGSAACSQGAQTTSDTTGADGSYNWTCGSGASQVSCAANVSLPNQTANAGTCGNASGTTVSALPSGSAACAAGTQNSTDSTASDGTYNWTCGSGSGLVTCSASKDSPSSSCPTASPSGDTCSASKTSTANCGCADGKTVTTMPSGTRACSGGTFNATDSTASDGAFNWTCRKSLTTKSCSASKYKPACGSANGAIVNAAPSCTAACSAGSAAFSDSTASDGTYNWTCNVGSQSVSCSANTSGGSTPAPAKCGSSNGQTVFGVWAWNRSGAVSRGACAVAAGQDGSNKRTSATASNGYKAASSFYKWDCVNGSSTVSCAANAVSNMVFTTDKTTYKRGQTGTFSWNCSANYPQATKVIAMAGDGTTVGTVFGPGWPSNSDLWSNGGANGPGSSAWPLSGSWTMDVTKTCNTASSGLGGKVTTFYVGVMCRGYLDPSASGDYGTSTSYDGLGWGQKQITIDCVN